MACNDDLIATATVAGDLGVADDSKVQRAVTAASQLIAKYCNRVFNKRIGIVESVKGTGRPRILLARPPLLAITSIKVYGTTLASTEYELEDAAQGIIRRTWSATFPRTGFFPGEYVTEIVDVLAPAGGTEGIEVTYTGGYVTPGQNAVGGELAGQPVTLPVLVQEAAALAAAAIYRRRELDQHVAAESLGNWSVQYRGELPSFIPPEVADMLSSYVLLRVP